MKSLEFVKNILRISFVIYLVFELHYSVTYTNTLKYAGNNISFWIYLYITFIGHMKDICLNIIIVFENSNQLYFR